MSRVKRRRKRSVSLLALGIVSASAGPIIGAPSIVVAVQQTSDDLPASEDSDQADFLVRLGDASFGDKTKELLGPRFGGMWLTGSAESTSLHIGATNLSQGDIGEIKDLAGSDAEKILVEEVKYSETDLLGFLDKISQIVQEELETAPASVSPRYSSNQIAVVLSEPQDAIADRATLDVPNDAFSIAIDPELTVGLLDSRDNFPPYKAAQEIEDRDSFPNTAPCTSAYIMYWKDGPNQGQQFGTSAGHCTTDFVPFYGGPNGSRWVGDANLNSWRTFGRRPVEAYSDAVRIAPLASNANPTREIYINPNFSRTVVGRLNNTELSTQDFPLCSSGRTTGAECGTLSSPYPSNTFNIPVTNDGPVYYVDTFYFACFSADLQGGDSGAPVFQVTGSDAKAGGIVSHRRGGTETCFDLITNVENRLGGFVRQK